MMKYVLAICLTISLFPFLASGQPCQITQITATPLPCNNYSFYVSVNLSVTNPASPGFTLAGNGVIYGTWLYSDLPVVVGPLYGDNESQYELIAWDVENPACQNFTSFKAADCGPIPVFANFTLDSITCITTSIAAVTVNFTHQNTSEPTFDLRNINNAVLGTYLYSSLPVDITNFVVNGASPITVRVCDHNNLASCKTFVVDAIDCTPNNCEIFNVTADPDCLNGNFVVNLNFEVDNPASDSFSVSGNGLNYGKFGYNELPVILGPLNGNSSINWVFNIQDSALPTCTGHKLLGMYHCPPPCDILNLEAMALECNGNDAYTLQVNMEIEGKGNSGYSIFSDNYFYGKHAYNQLPLTIPNFAVGNFIDQVTVCDNDNPGCCATQPFEALLCNGCIIYNLVANPLPCDNQGQFYISINFDYQNVSSEGFSITGNGTSYGNFNYSQVPVLLGPFPGDGSLYFEFVITDLVNEFCFDATEIGTLPCSAICSLSNLTAVTGDCTGNNTYILHVNFDHSGTLANGFDLYANGLFYDNYSYADLPLTILEFPSAGTGHDSITVCDNNNSNCCASIGFDAPDCHCSIYETTVQNLNCTSDTTFAISVEFFSQNLPGNSVDVFLDGTFIGTHNTDIIPFVVDNIPEGSGSALLTICGHEAGDCCDNVVIELMNCVGTECSIWELSAIPGECNSVSTYPLDITFHHANLPSDSVNIWANDNFIGTFLIQPDSIHIDQFPMYDSSTTTIKVCAIGSDTCCQSFTYNTPDCSGFGICHLHDLAINIGDCQSDSDYILIVDFQFDNLPTDSVVISANDSILGTYQVNEGHIILEHVPVSSGDSTTLHVCAAGSPDCCDEVIFATPICGNFNCNIAINFIEVGDCHSDSTYTLVVDFQSSNLPIDSVTVSANDTYVGTFQINEGHLILDNFPVLDSATTNLVICALSAPDCCANVTFNTPSCNLNVCSINGITVQVQDCSSDTTFSAVINFLYQNIPTGGFDVYTGDSYLGFFNFDQIPIVTSQFPANATGEYVVTICSSDQPDCCASFEFEGPVCGTTSCDISGLGYTLTNCDSAGNFFFVLNFQFQNTGASGFNVVGNGNEYGNFSYGQLPIQIGPFATNNTSYEFLVTDAENPACFDFIEPGVVNCLVGTTEVAQDEIFQVFNNGSLPGIFARKNISLSIFNSNGKLLLTHKIVNAGTFFELNGLPSGVYIGSILYQGNAWPVKLVKSGY